MQLETDLTGKLLIALPGIGDTRFERSVILLCAHTPEFAMGIVLNNPAQGVDLQDLMEHGNYPLQAALYLVALQRYLRQRLGDAYDGAVHLGGASYWFVRGMGGAETPGAGGDRDGVCSWRPAPAFLDGLDKLLGGTP